MFSKRPNSQKPNAALYAQFRQAHVHPTDVPSPSSSDSTAAVTQSNHTYPPKERRVPFSFHDSNLSRRSSPFNRIESDKPRHEPPIAPSLFDDRILGSVSRPIDPFSESSRGYSATDAEREDHWAPINTARLADDPTHDGLIHASTSVQPFGVWSDLPILDTTCSLGDTQLPPLSDSLPGLSHPYFYPETTASLLREEKPLDFLTMQDQADLGGTAMPYNQSFTTSGAADIAIPSQDLSTHSARFDHTLEAPSALMKEADGIPTTYLNKASDYTVIVRDANPVPTYDTLIYRSSFHIEFDAEHQRQDPEAFWKLRSQNKHGSSVSKSKEKSYTPPAIQCVEYHTPDRPEEMKTVGATHGSGFSILWSAPPSGIKQCSIVIRMSFLSTDFTHVQGVKGDAVRLYVKTEALSTAGPIPGHLSTADSSAGYCRIKLFRSHGAERKMSNDMLNANKRIKVLEEQLSQSQANRALLEQEGAEEGGKKAEKVGSKRARARLEDDLVKKIMKWSLLCGSAQEASHFRQYDAADAGQQPVVGEGSLLASVPEGSRSQATDETVSPVYPSHFSDTSSLGTGPRKRSPSEESDLAGPAGSGTGKRSKRTSTASVQAKMTDSAKCLDDLLMTPKAPIPHMFLPREMGQSQKTHGTKMKAIAKADLAGVPVVIPKSREKPLPPLLPAGVKYLQGMMDGVEDTDTLKHELPQCQQGTRNHSVACFYIRPRQSPQPHPAIDGKSPTLTRTGTTMTSSPTPAQTVAGCIAIYLTSRTAQEFVNTLAFALRIDPKSVRRCVWRTPKPKGVDVMVDDDVVRWLEEGREMDVEASWDLPTDGERASLGLQGGKVCELRVVF